MGAPDLESFLTRLERRTAVTEMAGERGARSEQRMIEGSAKPPDNLALRLETVTGRAIAKSEEILNFPLDPDSDHFPVVLRAQTAIVNSVLNTQTKVDENRLRARKPDVLPQLIKLIAEERARIKEQGLIS
jgi:hypothetical protein